MAVDDSGWQWMAVDGSGHSGQQLAVAVAVAVAVAAGRVAVALTPTPRLIQPAGSQIQAVHRRSVLGQGC
jgi:hypothetical protein